MITSLADLEALTSEWMDLHTEARGTPFTHPAWCLSWLGSYPRTQGRVIIRRGPSGRLDAVLPLAADPRRPRRLFTLGAPLVDFGTPLIHPRDDTPQSILEMLADVPGWRSVRLTGLSPAVADQLTARADGVGLVPRVGAGDDCPWIDTRSLATWASSLSAQRRRRLRAVDRHLDRLACERRELIHLDDVLPGLRRFEALRLQSWWHSGRWDDLPAETRETAHGNLLAAIATRSADTQGSLLTLAELVLDQRVLASAVLLRTGTNLLVAVVATDKRLGPAVSPGLALDAFIIRSAIGSGITRVDFGRGDEPYKFSLGARHQPTSDVTLTRRRTRWPS